MIDWFPHLLGLYSLHQEFSGERVLTDDSLGSSGLIWKTVGQQACIVKQVYTLQTCLIPMFFWHIGHRKSECLADLVYSPL